MPLTARAIWAQFTSAVATAVAVLLVFHFREFILPPPPGYCVGLVGVLAVVMTFVLPKEPSKTQKAAWITATFTLMALEMWAISHDRQQQNSNFEKIVSTLTSAMQQGQQEFQATISKENDVLDETQQVAELSKQTLGKSESLLQREEQVLKISTGGNEFCYLDSLSPIGDVPTPAGRWPLYIGNSGDVPLPFCDVQIFEAFTSKDTLEEKDRKWREIRNYRFTQVPARKPYILPTGYFIVPGPTYEITINTPTNMYREELSFLPVPPRVGGYSSRLKVWKFGKQSLETLPLLDTSR